MEWYGSNGREQMLPHPENDRVHDIVEDEYVDGLLQMGLLGACRGAAVATLSPGGMPPYLMVPAKTLTRAFYRADGLEPNIPQNSKRKRMVNKTVMSALP